MIGVVAAIARDPRASVAARIQAAGLLLDRGCGKAEQAVALTGKNGGPIESLQVNMTPAEFAEIARHVAAEV
jgi:hypothetical protein